VFIHQGVVQCRCQRGAVWVDLHARETTGVLKVSVYGEGQSQLDTSSEPIRRAERLVVELNTRGEFKLRTPRGQVQGQDRARDPVVTRAREAGVGSAPAASAPPPTTTGPGTLPEVPGTLPEVPGAAPVRPIGAIVPTGDKNVRYAIHAEARSDAPSGVVLAA